MSCFLVCLLIPWQFCITLIVFHILARDVEIYIVLRLSYLTRERNIALRFILWTHIAVVYGGSQYRTILSPFFIYNLKLNVTSFQLLVNGLIKGIGVRIFNRISSSDIWHVVHRTREVGGINSIVFVGFRRYKGLVMQSYHRNFNTRS